MEEWQKGYCEQEDIIGPACSYSQDRQDKTAKTMKKALQVADHIQLTRTSHCETLCLHNALSMFLFKSASKTGQNCCLVDECPSLNLIQYEWKLKTSSNLVPVPTDQFLWNCASAIISIIHNSLDSSFPKILHCVTIISHTV